MVWTIREMYVRTVEKLADVGGRSKAEQATDEFCNAPKFAVESQHHRKAAIKRRSRESALPPFSPVATTFTCTRTPHSPRNVTDSR